MQSKDGALELVRTHPYFWQIQGQLAVTNVKWCDLFVWLGDDHFLQRIGSDELFWESTMLPALCGFYQEHAVPYLKMLNRPVPPGLAPLQPNFSRCELLLLQNLCQSALDGRNGSDACTVIAPSFVRGFLQSAAAGRVDVEVSALLKAMHDGNAIYDSLETNSLLSVDEVMAIHSAKYEYCS